MKSTIIFSPDKETFERLRVLVNILFPEVDIFCVSDSRRIPEICPVNLRPNCTAVLRGNVIHAGVESTAHFEREG